MRPSCTKASQRTFTACQGHPGEGEIEMPLGHLLGLAIAVGEATYQTNASSGGSAVGFASYKVMHAERVCRKKIKAEGGIVDQRTKRRQYRSDTEDSTDGEALHGIEVSSVNPLKQWKARKPMYVAAIMEGQPIKMELETGAAVSMHHVLYDV